MAQEWDIKPRGDSCHKCERPFTDRQPYYSTLVFGDNGYARKDFCDDCWIAEEDNASPFSSWQGIYRSPPPPEEEALKKETAESLLRRLIEMEDDSKTNVIYILAVMLERKKVFVERDVKVNDRGELVRIYEQRKTGETFLIRDPRLELDQLEDVQEEVAVMLGARPRKQGSQETQAAENNPDTDEATGE